MSITGAQRAVAAGAAMLICACAGNELPEIPDPRPAPPGAADASVATALAAPGDSVNVAGSGFAPNADVEIGFGPPASEFSVITTTRANAAGRVDASVAVPGWAERGRSYVVVLNVPAGARAVTNPIVVGGPGDAIRIDGTTSTEGVECTAVRDRSGVLYTLTGLEESYPPNTSLRVWGRIAEASICMQGVTLQVDSIVRM